jgi:hypothetical protein
MLKQTRVSRRLLAAAALAAPALGLTSLSYAQTVLSANDDVTVRPSTANQHGSGNTALFIKSSSGQGNNGSDSVGYMEFDFTPGAYPTGFRSAILTVHPTDQYFTSLTGTAPNIAVQKYTPEYHYNVFGLPDAHPNENFDEATLKGTLTSSTVSPPTAVNVGPTTANNTVTVSGTPVADYYGLYRDGFTLDPRPAPRTPPAGYTNAEPGWVPTLAGQGSVRDTYRNDPDLNTYSYTATNANGTFQSATPDGVPDNSQTDISGNAENDMTVDVAEWINANDHNNIATFVIKRVEEADGGASFFSRTPTLTVTPGLPVYWDIDGNNPGAGGATPSGTWDGVANSFNINSAGAGAPADITPLVTSADTAVFGAGGDATGTYTVTLSGTRKAYQVNVEDGNVTLTGGTLQTRAVDVAAGATATVESSLVSPTGTVTKSGAGTLKVAKLPQSQNVSITGGRMQVLDSSPTFPSHPSGDDAAVSQPKSLAITAGATLDLGNNDMIIAYGASTPYAGTSPAAALEDQIASGFNGGDWLGTGITSSAAASDDAAGNFVLAIVDNASLPQPYGVTNGGDNFDGVDVPLESVLVKFTHRVDLNLDGLVTDADAIIFSTNYEAGAAANWGIGDLDYDGTFTDNDAIIFGTFYDTGLAHLPEPSAALLLGAGFAGLTRFRRRKA